MDREPPGPRKMCLIIRVGISPVRKSVQGSAVFRGRAAVCPQSPRVLRGTALALSPEPHTSASCQGMLQSPKTSATGVQLGTHLRFCDGRGGEQPPEFCCAAGHTRGRPRQQERPQEPVGLRPAARLHAQPHPTWRQT
jgi:hypothetical protein